MVSQCSCVDACRHGWRTSHYTDKTLSLERADNLQLVLKRNTRREQTRQSTNTNTQGSKGRSSERNESDLPNPNPSRPFLICSSIQTRSLSQRKFIHPSIHSLLFIRNAGPKRTQHDRNNMYSDYGGQDVHPSIHWSLSLSPRPHYLTHSLPSFLPRSPYWIPLALHARKWLHRRWAHPSRTQANTRYLEDAATQEKKRRKKKCYRTVLMPVPLFLSPHWIQDHLLNLRATSTPPSLWSFLEKQRKKIGKERWDEKVKTAKKELWDEGERKERRVKIECG